MAEPQYSHNHVINPETGFIENPAYSSSFDSEKKIAFINLYYKNGLRIRRTCDQLGMSVDTIHRHYQIDPQFKKLFDDVKEKYLDELEGVSRLNALNPKSVIERIFQLKCLLPEKYGQENRPINHNVTINVDGKLLEMIKKREQVFDAEIIPSSQISDGKQVDNQSK